MIPNQVLRILRLNDGIIDCSHTDGSLWNTARACRRCKARGLRAAQEQARGKEMRAEAFRKLAILDITNSASLHAV